MNLTIIEHHPQRVLEAFGRGEFDQIEIIGEADEEEFFELCFKEKILEALVKTMPSAKKKEEVPSWFILAANLSLKLHLENSFYAFETVVRCGGLLGALPTGLASQHLDPQTRRLLVCCQGFNDKNTYDRTTPCDEDTLRKAFKGVAAARWQQWYNAGVQEVFQRYGFFDPGGIFVGDGSYLFVPDNEACEGSVMKKLILDRGFIDGRKISHCHQELGVQVLIPMKKKMDIWDDAWALGQTQPWLDVPVPASVPRPVPANRPPEIQRRENKRQQTLAARKAQEPPPPLSQQWQRTQVCPIKGFTSWSETTVPMHVLLQNDPGPAPTVLGCDFGHWEFLGPCVIAHWAFCNSWR